MPPRKHKSPELPERVLAALEAPEGAWSFHAAEEKDRLGLLWADVQHLAQNSETLKKQRDRSAAGGYKYALTGRDLRGRLLYMAGKVVNYEDEKIWKVITIHEVR